MRPSKLQLLRTQKPTPTASQKRPCSPTHQNALGSVKRTSRTLEVIHRLKSVGNSPVARINLGAIHCRIRLSYFPIPIHRYAAVAFATGSTDHPWPTSARVCRFGAPVPAGPYLFVPRRPLTSQGQGRVRRGQLRSYLAVIAVAHPSSRMVVASNISYELRQVAYAERTACSCCCIANPQAIC